MKGYVYKLHNSKGYYYYGSSINPSKRHYQHYITCINGIIKSKLYERMRIDGFESFTMNIIEEVSDIMDIKRGIKIAEYKYIKQSLGDEFNLNTVTPFSHEYKCKYEKYVFTEQFYDSNVESNDSNVESNDSNVESNDSNENSVNITDREFTISNTVLSSSEEIMESIIHISDIHIRVGNHDKSRYAEYLTVFNNLFQSLSNQESIKNNTSVIVITGDLFHHKNKLEPYGLELALHLFRGLSILSSVFVIRGNHDYRQDVPNERDMISALMSYEIPNVHYLDKTDVYKFHNLSFGLVAIQDTLLYGATTGISPNLPPFPKGDSEYNIALFHGTISGCTLQTGQNTLNGYPIDWFQGFDAILLGDIHLQQVNRATEVEYTFAPLPSTSHVKTFSYEQSPWGYPGSLIQQDFGEPLFGHGYLLWSLKDKLVHAFHVHNPYGFVKMKNEEIIVDKKYTTIQNVISQNWFPTHLKISVLGDALDLKLFKDKNVLFTKISEDKKEQKSEQNDVVQINSMEVLIEYIQNKVIIDKKLFTDSWKGWLKNPEQLIISTTGYPDDLSTKINERSDKILKASSKYLEEFEKFTTQLLITGKMHIHSLQWSWILNYRDGNRYDFDNTNNICIINAKNGSGKSNFLEIICIALFGEGFPSRENPNYTSSIICDKKPAGTMANTLITFSLDNTKYILQRVMRPNSNARQINYEKIILSEVIDGEDKIIHQQKGAVHPWIDSHIGTLETYLMTAMLSQNADKDFFSLDKTTQKTLLDRIMSMDHINSLKVFLKEIDKYYKYSYDLIDMYYKGSIGSRDPHLDNQLDSAKQNVDAMQNISSLLQNQWNHVSERDLIHLNMTDAIKEYTEWMSLNVSDLSLLESKLSTINIELSHCSKLLLDYHSFSDIVVLESNVSTEYITYATQLLNIKQKLEQHPYYKTKSLYELREIDESYTTENPQKLFDLNKEFETWNEIKSSEYSEVYDDTDLVEALYKSSVICKVYPTQIATLTKDMKVARKKFLMLRKQKDEHLDKRPNKPSKTHEWIDTTSELLLMKDIDYIKYLEGFLLDSLKNVPALSNKILMNDKKYQEMSLYITECSAIPFNAKCKACKLQPWKKTYDQYVLELPLLERSLQQMRTQLTEYVYEEISFDILQVTEYISVATDILSGCTEYIQLHKLYSDEELLWKDYDQWQFEFSAICEKHDTAEKECDELDNSIKHLETVLNRSSYEKKDFEQKLLQMNQKKTDYTIYCSEKDRRSAEYDLRSSQLDYLWYSQLYSYHCNIGSLLFSVQSLQINLTKQSTIIITQITNANHAILMHKKASELRSVMDAYPYWTAWKTENEKMRQTQLLVRELETRCGNKVEGIDLSGIKSVMEVVAYLTNTFDGYREWLYKEHISPLIEKNVNSVLEMICEDRPLRLEGEWLDKISTLSWFVRDGSSRPVIEKASGFQRFIVGMACRVAFHQIGFCRIQYDQLFLDEGFTSCDSDNLEKVPDFLRRLLQMYDSIYLATHLDELKICADSQIVIDRDLSGLSQIRSTTAASAASTATSASVIVDVVEPKKKGRPTKKVSVTKSD